jgi:hypothetical protein
MFLLNKKNRLVHVIKNIRFMGCPMYIDHLLPRPDESATQSSRAATRSLKSPNVPFFNRWSLMSVFPKNGP